MVGRQECVLALDLGTTAFKCAPVTHQGQVGAPTVVRARVVHDERGVTCAPGLYIDWALEALAGAAETARSQGWSPTAIGISSQAQTFVTLGASGEPTEDAVVWTDDRAQSEAAELASLLPSFPSQSGFATPSPLQWLPKLVWMRRNRPQWKPHRVLLLPEWVSLRLAGRAVGDETLQGMCGLFDISSRGWNRDALQAVGLHTDQLADVAPAAHLSASLLPGIAGRIGISPVPVYSCGNDQACAAVGAGIERPGDALCNFGTAMIVYTVHSRLVNPSGPEQIAGIHPLGGLTFLLGVESEFGNVLEWLAGLLYGGDVGGMLEEACRNGADAGLPVVTTLGGGRLDLTGLSLAHGRTEVARAAVAMFGGRFEALLAGLLGSQPIGSLRAAGGASRSRAWLKYLGDRAGCPLVPLQWEHAGLAGIARIIGSAGKG